MRQPVKTEPFARGGVSATSLPLPTLLSQTLVAFTIEFDNEFEHRSPHRTTRHGRAGPGAGPWLTSMVMYSNLMRLVPAEGATVRKLRHQARTDRLSLTGMERWGHIVVAPDPADPRAKPPQADWVVRPTAKGRMAQEVWRSLFQVIEERWVARFGSDAIGSLRDALIAVVTRIEIALPEYLPVVAYDMCARVLEDAQPAEPGAAAGMHLAALLAKALLAFALEYERESDVSLALGANLLRVLGEEPVRMSDLPRLSDVSKEAIATSVNFLKARGYALVEAAPFASRGKAVRLTAKGSEARRAYQRLLAAVEERWQDRFGEDAIGNLRRSLEPLVGDTEAESPLFAGLKPYPDGWRASVRRPELLPHYPMVLHRGGYPDGS